MVLPVFASFATFCLPHNLTVCKFLFITSGKCIANGGDSEKSCFVAEEFYQIVLTCSLHLS